MESTSLHRLAVLVALHISFIQGVAAQSGEDFVKQMHLRYQNKWYKTLTFTQETEIYKNDSLLRKSTWYEMVRFPYELRIDVDSINGDNKTFYKKDSTYRVRKNKIQAVSVDPNPFIFFLGGMYMLPFDSVKATLARNGYNLALGNVTNWKNRKTYVIGAADDTDSTRNQFWVDAEHLYIVRIKVQLGNTALDVHLSDHIKLTEGWSETKVQFYRNGQLLQVEKYRDLKPDVVLSDDLFDLSRYR